MTLHVAATDFKSICRTCLSYDGELKPLVASEIDILNSCNYIQVYIFC